MMRETESRLVEFCVKQRSQFDGGAWLRFSSVARLELAVVTRYLAGVAWYGHQAALSEVAERLTEESFAELVRKTRFDPSRFGGLLKNHLRQAGQVVTA